MKKFARLMAVVLAGMMLLSMTACSGTSTAFNEETARAEILKEINDYRALVGRDPLSEYPELDERAAAFTKEFEKEGKILLNSEKIDWTEYDRIVTRNQTIFPGIDRWEDIGLKNYEDNNGVKWNLLLCEYSAGGMTKVQVRLIEELTDSVPNGIGIAFAHIGEKVYWYAELYENAVKA